MMKLHIKNVEIVQNIIPSIVLLLANFTAVNIVNSTMYDKFIKMGLL